MSVQHTAGPWEIDGNIAVRSSGPNGRQVCLCEITVRGRQYNETYDEAEANARLIAAAPDLLEALTDALFLMELSETREHPSWDRTAAPASAIGKARAAIAKADGTQVSQCDCCGDMKPRDQISRCWVTGIETFACDECRHDGVMPP